MQSEFLTDYQNRIYYKCNNCSSIFLSSDCRLDEGDEKARYLQHNNDINDERYRNFVSPITNYIFKKYTRNSLGLDFGSGTGPVISCILSENGYNINQYDPYFYPDNTVLSKNYDYIVCCEVIEHFYNPKHEFTKLYDSIKINGEIICKTDLFNKYTDFNKWHYKNDPTHVFFYSDKTFSWIKNYFGFTRIDIEDRLIVLEK